MLESRVEAPEINKTHTSNPSTQEAETGGSLSSRTARIVTLSWKTKVAKLRCFLEEDKKTLVLRELELSSFNQAFHTGHMASPLGEGNAGNIS